MMTDVYRKYFQKSYNFLYPLLGIKKHKTHRPFQTYLVWPGVCDTSSRKLICVFKPDYSPEWLNFEKNVLIPHRMLDEIHVVDDETVVYVFDFNCYKEDYDAFLRGKYSQISLDSKKLMSNYFGVHTPEWVYMESYIYPKKYFKIYSEILGVEIEHLESVGELCEELNVEKETCEIVLESVNL